MEVGRSSESSAGCNPSPPDGNQPQHQQHDGGLDHDDDDGLNGDDDDGERL